MKGSRVALVHDHLVQDGGAERVLRAMMRLWPEAPVYTAYFDPARMGPDFPPERIRASYLQRVPLARRFYKLTMPALDSAFRRFDLSDYDLVVSSASGWAKSVRTPSATHVCFCHTPTRYLWSDADTYRESTGYPAPLKAVLKGLYPRLRQHDLRAAAGVDAFVANSRFVADRIQRYYGRDSEVVYPPVDITAFRPDLPKSDYFLVATRLEPYKRGDLAITAANQLQVPLKVMGSGTELAKLKALAGPTIEFTGRVSDTERTALFGGARAFINPQVEDFGITAVEALASGTPVIAYGQGGAAEIIEDGQTGILFHQQSAEAVAAAMRGMEKSAFAADKLRARAEQFSEPRFARELQAAVAAAAPRQ